MPKGNLKINKLKQKYLLLLKEAKYKDKEMAHIFADDALCDLLIELGFDEIVNEYNTIDKWYA